MSKLNSNPFAALAESDGDFVSLDNNKKDTQKKTAAQAKKTKEQNTKELREKASKVFKQKNELSEQQKRDRNRKKKEKAKEKKDKSKSGGGSVKSPTVAPKAATAGASATAGGPAAPTKSYEELKREYEEKRQRGIKDYLSAVESALPGYTVFLKLDLKQLPQKESNQVMLGLREKPFKAIEQIMQSKFFLDAFTGAVPEKLKPSKPPAIGRIDIRSIFIPDFPLHLASLLTGLTINGNQKTPDEAYSLVDEFLEGLFGVKVAPKKQNDEDEDDDLYYVGSAGNLKNQQVTLSDFLSKKLPATASTSEKKEGGESAPTTTTTENKSAEETKSTSEPKSPSEGSSSSSSSAAATGGASASSKVKSPKQDLNDPTSWLSEEVQTAFPATKLGTLAQRIPKGWKVAKVRSPVFLTGLPEKGGFAGAGGRGGSAGGRGRGGSDRGGRGAGGRGAGGRGAPGSPTMEAEAPKPGFMYAGNGLDHCYLAWKGDTMFALFTTGLPTAADQTAPSK